MFISFEGIDGSGKTTQAALLASVLRSRATGVVLTREPGHGTPLSELIRHLFLDPRCSRLHPLCEVLLAAVSRLEHVRRVISPSLAQGKAVVTDRFLDSTVAYQGHGRGADIRFIEALHGGTAGILPDLTFLLDIEPSVALARKELEMGKMEMSGEEFLRKVRCGFVSIAKDTPRFRIIPGTLPAELIHRQVVREVWPTLAGK